MESGVWGKESREISGEISDLASPSEWDLRSRKLRPKPRRFEGEAREQILEWAKSNGHSGRIIDDGFASWETWGTDKMRSIQSWADTFKGFVRRGLANGEIQAETASERASREAEEFRESAAGARPEPGGRNQIH
jgi:hypothetical protein